MIFAFHSKGACEARQYAEMVPQMAVAHCAHFSEVWFGALSTAQRARKTTLRKQGHNGQQWKVRLESVPVSSALGCCRFWRGARSTTSTSTPFSAGASMLELLRWSFSATTGVDPRLTLCKLQGASQLQIRSQPLSSDVKSLQIHTDVYMYSSR